MFGEQISMNNIIIVKVGDIWSKDYLEYHFQTSRQHEEIIDSNGNPTFEFLTWLHLKHKEIYCAHFNKAVKVEYIFIDCDDLDMVNWDDSNSHNFTIVDDLLEHISDISNEFKYSMMGPLIKETMIYKISYVCKDLYQKYDSINPIGAAKDIESFLRNSGIDINDVDDQGSCASVSDECTLNINLPIILKHLYNMLTNQQSYK